MRSLLVRTPLQALAGLLVCCSFLASCDREPTAPPTPPSPSDRVLGLVEVTISGIGTEDMHASASVVSVSAPGTTARELALDLTPIPGGDGTIQLAPLSAGSFTEGERGNGGERYLYATFDVRNAASDGTAYSTPLQNLTLLAVSTPSTIAGTAISKMNKFDGSAADPALALQLLPTGAVTQNPATGDLASASPDVLQVLTEGEAASFPAPPSVTTVFPYGFVVRNSIEPRRILQKDPRPDQFDGIATFAFRVPLQASPADDPFTVSALFVAVEDDTTRITQSLEEQRPAGEADLAARAQALHAIQVTLLPGGRFTGPILTRRICRVRTAGPTDAPSATLVNAPDVTLQSLSPNPHATDGSASFLASPATFTATFSTPVSAPTAENFVVNGSQSGRHFLGESFRGGGTNTVTSPSGAFFPGEEIEVVLTGALQGCGAPTVARFRVRAPTPSTGPSNAGQSVQVADDARALAAGDVNGDGKLDAVTVNTDAGTVSVLLGNGDGTFQPGVDYATGNDPVAVALGDLNGDGALDLVTANPEDIDVSVLLGRGDGTFPMRKEYSTALGPTSVAIGDMNGDGRLDLVVATAFDGLTQEVSAISVLLGNGDGTFRTHADYPTAWSPSAVQLADLNGDGFLDVATANLEDPVSHPAAANAISVLLGNGDGTLQSHVEYAIGTSHDNRAALDVAIGDLNTDGIPDLVAADAFSAEKQLSVLLGNGDGTFQSHVEYSPAAASGDLRSIAIADLNGDGKLDLVATGPAPFGEQNNVDILPGRGDGTFPTSTQASTGGLQPTDVTAGDLNGDGKVDVIFIASDGTHRFIVTRMNQ